MKRRRGDRNWVELFNRRRKSGTGRGVKGKEKKGREGKRKEGQGKEVDLRFHLPLIHQSCNIKATVIRLSLALSICRPFQCGN